jgi:phosphoribosylformimino-5-aminoimidazole carboxamide ribotide isomerase
VRLYPAVDILGGSAVRLLRGDYGTSTVYDEDPLEAARAWSEQGARYLHVVDLDGARCGAPANLSHLRRITSALEVPVQYGGGLRSLQAVGDALDAGAARVILGTAALTAPDLLGEALAAHGPARVLVSVDVRGGRVATAGWTQAGDLGPQEAIERLKAVGVERFIFTNVDRDGMLQGPDLAEVRRVAAAVRGGSVLYSGGIGELADLEALARMRAPELRGVIVGKALYERRFTVAQAEAALSA